MFGWSEKAVLNTISRIHLSIVKSEAHKNRLPPQDRRFFHFVLILPIRTSINPVLIFCGINFPGMRFSWFAVRTSGLLKVKKDDY